MASLPAGQHMEAFVVVAEKGGFSAAARYLHLAQSTLSRQMEQLEQTVGCTLFVRTPTGTRLTAAGKILYGYAKRVLAELADLQRRLDAAGACEVVQLATITGPLYNSLPSAVTAFERRHGLRVSVREAASDDIVGYVRSRRADLGILNLPVDEGLQVEVLAESELALLVPQGHPLSDRRRADLRQVRDETFVLQTEDQALYRLALSACHAAGFSPRVAYHTRDAHLCIHLVAQGCGVSIVPGTGVLKRLSSAVHFIRIEPPFKRILAAVYADETPVVRSLTAHLKQAFRAFGR